MFGNYFYWASARKVIAVFGNMFNNISIQRVDADSNVVKKFKVPIEQAAREHYLVRKLEEAKKHAEEAGMANIGITLPRMSYELTGLQYDPENRLPLSRYIRSAKSLGDGNAIKMFNPVPYVMTLELSLYAKNIDDALQIVEQIVPYFGPHLSVTINEVPEMDFKNDIKIQLDGFTTTTDYESHIGGGRYIIWTFTFSIGMRFYHPMQDTTVIKKVIENIHASHSDETKVDAIITQTVDPLTADENDLYTINYDRSEP